jgi:hypothetical protein
MTCCGAVMTLVNNPIHAWGICDGKLLPADLRLKGQSIWGNLGHQSLSQTRAIPYFLKDYAATAHLCYPALG